MKFTIIPKVAALLLVTTALLVSCTKNFEELNTDPNRPKEVTPGVMLGQMQYKFVTRSIDGSRRFTHELMQVTAPRSSVNGGIHRYVITPSSNDFLWTGFYTSLTDVQDMYNIASKLNESNYMAISLIYKSWAYSILTDAFGDLPYSQSTQASTGVLKPAFDQQKDIYPQILKDLATANTLLNNTKALTYGGDFLYNANTLTGSTNEGINRWKKFCNSLRLRLLLRISKRSGEIDVNSEINAILADPVKNPVFTSTADDAIFRFPGTFPFFNPYYNARLSDWRQGDYYTKLFINKMNTDEDPRRAVWATQVAVNGANVYQGIDSGYPSSTEYVVDKNSSYSDGLKTLPQLGIMMTYAEVEFIKAELALKGFATGNPPQKHYENGITASMAQWGVALPAGYLQKAGVAYNSGAGIDAQLQQIMLQKYYAFYFVDYQSWFEKRRTGYPVLPRGAGIPDGNLFPSRCPYPVYLQSLNPDNLAKAVTVMGGDNSNVKVWWDK